MRTAKFEATEIVFWAENTNSWLVFFLSFIAYNLIAAEAIADCV
jgi:hypothetical protein